MTLHVRTLTMAAVLAMTAPAAFAQSGPSAAPAPATTAAAQGQARQQDFQLRIGGPALQTMLTRMRTNAETMRNALYQPGRGRGRAENDLTYLLTDLIESTNHLSDHVARRVVTQYDVESVLTTGNQIEAVMARGSYQQVSGAWQRLNRDLDELGRAYVPPMNWRDPVYGRPQPPFAPYAVLSGTYRLDPSRSQDPQRAMQTVLQQVAYRDRDRVQRQLSVRLNPPDVLSIERNQRHVQIASSRGPRLEFEADGRPDVTTGPAGATITTRASMFGDRLQVTTKGGPGIDYSVTFEPADNGRTLVVTRELFDENLRTPVSVRSVYTRTAERPDWNVYTGVGDVRGGRDPRGAIVPSGAVLSATLDRAVDLRSSRQNDRVSLTVHDWRPELDGAVIEGYLIDAPSRSSNRYGLVLDFDRIRLRDGRTADFEGWVEEVRVNDRVLQVEKRDNDRSDQAISRGVLGAAIGAVIGAVAGGGKGAAIGAAIGAAGGASTVFIDGNNVNELPRGSAFTIRAR